MIFRLQCNLFHISSLSGLPCMGCLQNDCKIWSASLYFPARKALCISVMNQLSRFLQLSYSIALCPKPLSDARPVFCLVWDILKYLLEISCICFCFHFVSNSICSTFQVVIQRSVQLIVFQQSFIWRMG